MKNLRLGPMAAACLFVSLSCKWMQPASNVSSSDPMTSASPTPTLTPIGDIRSTTSKRAFRIEGTIDDARQQGNVYDTSVEFKVPGTLEFKFTPTSASKGEYTYSGPFNATGSGPYEIKDDGTMIVDGTGCIMGRCSTYSHKWKAAPLDAATCKSGK